MGALRSMTVLAVAVLAVAPASARPSPPALDPAPSVPVYAGLPTPQWTFEPVLPPIPGAQAGIVHVDGDAPPGWGTGSLQFVLGASSEGDVHIVQSLAGLQSLTVWERQELVPNPPAYVQLRVSAEGEAFRGELPSVSTWTKVDLTHLTLHPDADPGQSTTLADIAVAHPTTATLTLAAFNAFDQVGTQAYLDGWSWKANGTVQAFDFEAPHLPTTCTLAAAPRTILAGTRAHLTAGLLDDLGAGVPGAALTLWAQRFDEAAPHRVSAVTTGPLGGVALLDSPTRQTTYLVDHAQTTTLGRCRSAAVTVSVKTRVTLDVADTTVRRGGRIEATGATRPRKAGAAVTLWRDLPAGPVRLATGRTSGTGTFRLTAPATSAGRWQVYVTVGAASGNKAGTSRRLLVSVS